MIKNVIIVPINILKVFMYIIFIYYNTYIIMHFFLRRSQFLREIAANCVAEFANKGKKAERESQMREWSVKSLNGWIKDIWCKRKKCVWERERERERERKRRRQSDEIQKWQKIQKYKKRKNNRYICDCDFWRDSRVRGVDVLSWREHGPRDLSRSFRRL